MHLDELVRMSQLKIREFYEHFDGKVAVATSGGKDSTVLLHLVRRLYPEVPAVFNDTGLEFPEIREFVRTTSNLIRVVPKLNFKAVIKKYGYPLVSKEVSQKIHEAKTTKSEKLLHKRLHGDNNKYKSGKIPNKWQFLIYEDVKISHKCCDVLKKNPAKKYTKDTGRYFFIGTMATDSHLRMQQYVQRGCNRYTGRIHSAPLSPWETADVWEYIEKFGLEVSRIYSMGYQNTGCVFCMFGVHREKVDLLNKNKFQRLKETHPKLHNYCINTLGEGKVLDRIGVPY